MPDTNDYVKTQKGLEELSKRKHLPQKLRTMLILINGATSAETLLEQGTKLGVPTGFIEELESQGFIAKAGAQTDQSPVNTAAPDSVEEAGRRFILAKDFLNISAVNTLGLRAFFFTLKLEKCATLDDLRKLLPSYTAAITKAAGKVEAEVFSQQAQALLR